MYCGRYFQNVLTKLWEFRDEVIAEILVSYHAPLDLVNLCEGGFQSRDQGCSRIGNL